MEMVRTRADCCIQTAQAIYFNAEQELYFCQHHANKHEPMLLAEGWTLLTKHTAETIDNRTLVPVE
jgi:hypothetical protein